MSSQDGTISTLERAIELARRSSCSSIADIKRTLNREGYDGVDVHLAGSTIKKKLTVLMRERKLAEAS